MTVVMNTASPRVARGSPRSIKMVIVPHTTKAPRYPSPNAPSEVRRTGQARPSRAPAAQKANQYPATNRTVDSISSAPVPAMRCPAARATTRRTRPMPSSSAPSLPPRRAPLRARSRAGSSDSDCRNRRWRPSERPNGVKGRSLRAAEGAPKHARRRRSGARRPASTQSQVASSPSTRSQVANHARAFVSAIRKPVAMGRRKNNANDTP
jgi:hypothetical protein